MPALLVEPSCVIEFVVDVPVVANVALAVCRGHVVQWPGGADQNDAIAVRRPLEILYAILELGKSNRLATGHRQHINLASGGVARRSFSAAAGRGRSLGVADGN